MCIWRGWLSSRTFHNSFMRPTVAGLSSVSLRCHDVRSLSYPSVSQFAFGRLCAPGLAVNPTAAITAATMAPPLRYDMRAPAARLRTRARDERLARPMRLRRPPEPRPAARAPWGSGGTVSPSCCDIGSGKISSLPALRARRGSRWPPRPGDVFSSRDILRHVGVDRARIDAGHERALAASRRASPASASAPPPLTRCRTPGREGDQACDRADVDDGAAAVASPGSARTPG